MRYLFLFLGALSLTFADSSWMHAQIQEDLAAFPPKSLKRQMLTQLMEGKTALHPTSELMHIAIEKGEICIKGFVTSGWDGASFRLREVLCALKKWQRYARALPSRKLPDTEFLLSVGDGLDTNLCQKYVDIEGLSVPIFVFCKRNSSRQLVLFPDSGALAGRSRTVRAVKRGDWLYAWPKKKESLFWRGAASDGLYSEKNWWTFPRASLVMHSRRNRKMVDAAFTALPQLSGSGTFDAIVEKTGELAPYVTPQEHIQYKYLMDIDGNSNGWDRCFWGLLSSSALFKQESPFSQWYYKALVPGRHYVAIQHDLSNLEEQIEWARSHDADVRSIARRGQEIATEVFRRGAIFEYVQKLLTEYNKRFED